MTPSGALTPQLGLNCSSPPNGYRWLGGLLGGKGAGRGLHGASGGGVAAGFLSVWVSFYCILQTAQGKLPP